jgi:hypothetical protein
MVVLLLDRRQGRHLHPVFGEKLKKRRVLRRVLLVSVTVYNEPQSGRLVPALLIVVVGVCRLGRVTVYLLPYMEQFV